MQRTRTRGFSLVEIIICITIIAILAVLGGSVYMQAKRSSKIDVEISQMHQIGLAANMYHEQYEAWPNSTVNLVAAGLIPKSECLSPLDQYKNGLSNEWLREHSPTGYTGGYVREVAPFPNTYFSVGDLHLGLIDRYQEIFEQQNCGLFISLTTTKDAVNPLNLAFVGEYSGAYRRVLLDGAVITRRHGALHLIDSKGKQISYFSNIAMFFDPSEEWKLTLGKQFD